MTYNNPRGPQRLPYEHCTNSLMLLFNGSHVINILHERIKSTFPDLSGVVGNNNNSKMFYIAHFLK